MPTISDSIMANIQPVILCGGSGTRLWPASRSKYPKQFMSFGNNSSLFAETLRRIEGIHQTLDVMVISNNEYRFYIDECLKDTNRKGTIILEPEGRNTAPAIALAGFATMETEDALMLVMPSDHMFEHPEAFRSAVESAQSIAEAGYLVTFGINPIRPETGYGYIKQGNALGESAYCVERFLEKPQKAKAEAMLKEGGYYWNAGIFLFKASVFLTELEKYAPAIYQAVKTAWQTHYQDLSFLRPGTSFLDSPSDSIDYAIMEHSDKVAVVPMDGGWSDLGSWESFYEIADKDTDCNACEGDVMLSDTTGCYLKSTGRLIAAVGVRNLAVIETKDAVLVADRSKTQDVKAIVNLLKANNRTETDLHPLVHRPWGHYETLVLADGFQVKRITVHPGSENSLQMHYHRAEHWIIVRGIAEVTIGGEQKLIAENESVYVPLGTKHRIKNPGPLPLEFIEVQTGSYFGEDDIVRFEDNYGRADTSESAMTEARNTIGKRK